MLITCEECGRQYSNNAPACPGCANPTPVFDPVPRKIIEALDPVVVRAETLIRKGQPNRFIALTTGLSFKKIDELRAQIADEPKPSEASLDPKIQSSPDDTKPDAHFAQPTPSDAAAEAPEAAPPAPMALPAEAASPAVGNHPAPEKPKAKIRRGYSARPKNEPSVGKEMAQGCGTFIGGAVTLLLLGVVVMGIIWLVGSCSSTVSSVASSAVNHRENQIISEINKANKRPGSGRDFLDAVRIEWIVREGSEWRGVIHYKQNITGRLTYYPSTGKWFTE